MAEKAVQTRIVHKHDTKANWEKAKNFVPKQGELIIYDDVKDISGASKIKIGDGSTLVAALPFASDITLSRLGITATATELNTLDGITATTTELNYVDGVTSNIQTQLDSKKYWANVPLSGSANSSTTPTFSPNFLVNVGSNSVIQGAANKAISMPLSKYLWHDLFSFGVNGHPTIEISTDSGTTWADYSDEALQKKLFIQREDQVVVALSDTTPAIRWTWYSTQFHACQATYLNIGFGYQSSQATFNLLFETSTDNETWTTGFSVNGVKYASAPYWFYLTTNWSKQYYVRLTLTRTSASGTKAALASIKLLTSRWGNQGRGSEYEKPYSWDSNQNIYPRTNNTSTLGTTSYKWNNVYSTKFTGTLTGNADTATKLATAKTINLTGDVTGSTSFDGSENVSIAATIAGGASTIASSNLTASRALVSNSSGKVAVSAVTSAELGHLDGVTSNIQTQLNNKQPKGDYVSYTTETDVDILGTTKPVYILAPPTNDGDTGASNAPAYFPEGILMGGTAQSAGLMARGICGISTPQAATGACQKDNLYVNYDGTDDYVNTRHLILQAGTPGTHYGNNVYQYAAVRGDALKNYCDATYAKNTEEWTFTYEDGTTETKTVFIR